MQAARVIRFGGPAAIEVGETPEPAGGDRVLIEVAAAGVTYPDVLLAHGTYHALPGLPFIPGAEVAGVVRYAPVGSELSAGARVAAYVGLGGFAEVAAAPPHAVFPLPPELGFEAGAALPLNYLTLHFALHRRAGLREGETVLVHGAAGGVGTAAVQLAKLLGARVLAVVSTPEKGAAARAAGADEVVAADGFREAVAELMAGRGVDLVVDPVGGERFTDSLRSLAPEGRLLVLGFTAGQIPTVKVNRLLLNNISVVGVAWGPFWASRPDYPREQWEQLLPHLRTGRLAPVLGPSYPLHRAADAVAALDERRAVGRVLLKPR